MANKNITQLTPQTGSADPTSLFYTVTGGNTDKSLPLSVLFNSPTFTGNPTIPFTQIGTGAVVRTVQSKEQDWINIVDFGAVGNGTTDDTVAIQNALNALGTAGGTVLIPRGLTPLINSNLNIPANCFVVGSGSTTLGNTTNPAANLNTWPHVILNTSATITLNNASGWKNLAILAKGITFNETSAQVTANFLGTALTIANNVSDVLIEDFVILGFNTAISTAPSVSRIDRPRIHRGAIDCINGIYLQNMFDVPYISEIHGWPFVTLQSVAEGNSAQLKRSGTFIQLNTIADYAKVTNCFSFGWATGFSATGNGGGGITWLSCGADHPPGTTDGSVGWNINGSIYESRLIGCQTSAKDTGVIVNTTDASNGKIYIDTTNIWATNITALSVTSGVVRVVNSGFRNTGGINTGITAAAGTDVALTQCDILGFNVGISTTAITTVVRHRFCTFTGTTIPLNNPYQPSIASASPLVLNGVDSNFTVTGTTGFSTVNSAAVYAGKTITLEFAGTLTVSTGGNITDLAGNFVTTAGYTLTLYSDGSVWYEVSRSMAGNYTALNLAINGATSTTRAEQFQTSGLNRWQVRTSNETESGSNAGSNFNIDRYNDAGGFLDSPININRASGNITVADGLIVNGNIVPSTLKGITGTTLADNANAGSIGEMITATATSVSLTSGTAATITSIPLTAGDWDVWCTVKFNPAATTTMSNLVAGTSLTNNTVGALGTYVQSTAAVGAASGQNEVMASPHQRINVSTITTVYAIAQAVFGGSTMTADALIAARRRR